MKSRRIFFCMVWLLAASFTSALWSQSFVRHGDSRLTDQVLAKNPLWVRGGVHSSLKAYLASGPSGLTPTQIKHAYGLDQITGDGTGQTIAIVEAYGSPTIVADVAAFCTAFNLPPANVAVYYPQGQGRANSGWALETSLDVEWAHAIAPGANIVVVAARSASLSNLLGAVDYAVSLGASQVSMSWGGSEFAGQTGFDYHFNVPGVAFFASSGDSGAGASWPAASPFVISVGGTTLNVDGSGNVVSETGWSGSGGGLSAYETRPGYQNGWQTAANRAIPDVSYDADPATGFPVYMSNYNGSTGWITVGGTSAGAPQWAGLSALVNAARTTAVQAPDNALYTLASAGYATDFRDITAGSNGGFTAIALFDLVTGLGSPAGAALIPALQGITNPVVSPPLLAVSQGGNSLANGAGVSFGTATQGDPVVTQDIVVANMGNSNLVLSATLQAVGSSTASGFVIITPPPSHIAPNGSATVRVGMNTSTVGAAAANLVIASNDSTQNPFTVALTGTVSPSNSQIVVTSGSTAIASGGTLAFGSTVVGVPLVQTLTVSDPGTSDLKLTGWLVAASPPVAPGTSNPSGFDHANLFQFFREGGPFGGQREFRLSGPFPLPRTVSAGGSANVQLTYNAATLGDKSAQLLIFNNVTPSTPFIINLTGHADPNPNAGQISVTFSAGSVASGGTASFGTTPVGTPVVNTFTVTNSGGGTLQFYLGLQQITPSPFNGWRRGYHPPAFTILSNPSTTLAPGQSSAVQVQFAPGSAATSYSSLISVGSRDPSAGSYTATLTGASQ